LDTEMNTLTGAPCDICWAKTKEPADFGGATVTPVWEENAWRRLWPSCV
jgi:hypothetical protein